MRRLAALLSALQSFHAVAQDKQLPDSTQRIAHSVSDHAGGAFAGTHSAMVERVSLGRRDSDHSGTRRPRPCTVAPMSCFQHAASFVPHSPPPDQSASSFPGLRSYSSAPGIPVSWLQQKLAQGDVNLAGRARSGSAHEQSASQQIQAHLAASQNLQARSSSDHQQSASWQQQAHLAASHSRQARAPPKVPISCFKQDTQTGPPAGALSDKVKSESRSKAQSQRRSRRQRAAHALPVSCFSDAQHHPEMANSDQNVQAPTAATAKSAKASGKASLCRLQPETTMMAPEVLQRRYPHLGWGGAQQARTKTITPVPTKFASAGLESRPTALPSFKQAITPQVVPATLQRSSGFSFQQCVSPPRSAKSDSIAALLQSSSWWFSQCDSRTPSNSPVPPTSLTVKLQNLSSRQMSSVKEVLDACVNEVCMQTDDNTLGCNSSSDPVPTATQDPASPFSTNAYLFENGGLKPAHGRKAGSKPEAAGIHFDGDLYLFGDAPPIGCSPASDGPGMMEIDDQTSAPSVPSFSFGAVDAEACPEMPAWPPARPSTLS